MLFHRKLLLNQCLEPPIPIKKNFKTQNWPMLKEMWANSEYHLSLPPSLFSPTYPGGGQRGGGKPDSYKTEKSRSRQKSVRFLMIFSRLDF
jgi:hypothetical protein